MITTLIAMSHLWKRAQSSYYKGVAQYQNGALGKSRLMQILLRDSLIYFLV